MSLILIILIIIKVNRSEELVYSLFMYASPYFRVLARDVDHIRFGNWMIS
jgi:hypothetical protein